MKFGIDRLLEEPDLRNMERLASAQLRRVKRLHA